MAVATSPRILQLPDGPPPRVAWALGLSLLFHCFLLAIFAGLRLAPVERPQGSIEVALVSLSPTRTTAAPKPAAPVQRPQTPPPVPAAPPPKPVPVPVPRAEVTSKMAPLPVRQTPAPAPTPTPAPTVPSAAKATAPRVAALTAAPPPVQAPPVKKDSPSDLLKHIELPPEVPQLGDLPRPSSAASLRKAENYKADPAAQKLSNKIRDLQIPDASMTPAQSKATPLPADRSVGRPIVSADILEKLQRPVEQLQQLPEHRPPDPTDHRMASAKTPAPSSSPDQAAPVDLTPATTIQAMGAGSNRYWALVQQKINSKWIAPPVDLADRFFQVAIRFTMDRSGRVVAVVIERSSGNDYYDNAGRRAVLAADPLPPFPAEMKERQLSPLIYFSVGEQQG